VGSSSCASVGSARQYRPTGRSQHRLDRDDEDTERSMAGCLLGTVGGGEGGLGLNSGDVRGLSSRGMREAGAWYTGGLEDIGVGMGSFILDSLDGKTRILETLG
jgi:hypothetical protein